MDEQTPSLRQSPYRVSQRERLAIRDQEEEMLREDVIQPSKIPWAAPVVRVRNKYGALQFCVDYRRLNTATMKDVYPLPTIDDALDRPCHGRYFTSLDLKSYYWQIEVDKTDREKTAFITPDGLYEFMGMPFWALFRARYFSADNDTVFVGLKWQTRLVCLDDVVVFATRFANTCGG